MRKITLRGLGKSGAANGQVPVWDDVNQVWVPADQTGSGGGSAIFHQADEPLSAVEGDLWVDSDDPGPGGGSGGGGGGVLLLEYGASVPPGTAVGTIIFQKPAPTTTWDFKGLSALPSGWTRRGVASETFAADGMSATYTAGQGHQVPVPSGIGPDYTLETKMISGPATTVMLGPIVADTEGAGFCLSWYTQPIGANGLKTSAWQYGSVSTNAGGSPAYPVWFRIRVNGNSFYPSYSMDGSTWSAEPNPLSIAITPAYFSFGSIYGSASAKIEYMTYSPGSLGNSGKALGWWDGSTIQPLG